MILCIIPCILSPHVVIDQDNNDSGDSFKTALFRLTCCLVISQRSFLSMREWFRELFITFQSYHLYRQKGVPTRSVYSSETALFRATISYWPIASIMLHWWRTPWRGQSLSWWKLNLSDNKLITILTKQTLQSD